MSIVTYVHCRQWVNQSLLRNGLKPTDRQKTGGTSWYFSPVRICGPPLVRETFIVIQAKD